MGLIAPSSLGTCGMRCSSRAHPFASRLGVTQVSRGLALVNILSTNMYLGSDTIPVSPGASPVTLAPGVGVEISSSCVLQVSVCLYTLYIYFTDITEVYRANPGPFRAIFDLPRWGGQNRKNRDCARTRRAIVSRFSTLILVPGEQL